jgi:hypothetical protein
MKMVGKSKVTIADEPIRVLIHVVNAVVLPKQ